MKAMRLVLGRSACANQAVATAREWLVTNGIGGFAGGTVGDVPTRRYHGLLFAALHPPLGRTLLLAKLDAAAEYDGQTYPLSANRWSGGTLDAGGLAHLDRFTLDGTVPTWSYVFSDACIERTIWMERGQNATYVRYTLQKASTPVTLTLKALVNARDYHALTQAYDLQEPVSIEGRTTRVRMYAGAAELVVQTDVGQVLPGDGWYYGFRLDAETERGLDDREDHFHAVTLRATLSQGETLTVTARSGAPADDPAASYDRQRGRDEAILQRWRNTPGAFDGAPPWIERLVLAADQFIVERNTSGGSGQTVIAGYPWFGDWGRDTMIALPGLALVTGRETVARDVLSTFAHFVDRGMLPNRFPDAGEAPEYNTVDATLWYVDAVRRYVEDTGDDALLEGVFPALEEIVAWHCGGTRYGIRVDQADGLLYAGEDGVQLTWMDAKVGDRVITPRTGKAVEINALWYNALVAISAFARQLGKPHEPYRTIADRTAASFGRFWNDATGYCYDVIDGPYGSDAAIRPNAVIAASLAHTPLTLAQRARIVHVAGKQLVTPYGLRSLSPNDPQYQGRYTGVPEQRDGAYHQGTVWPWLLGPFVGAHLAVHGDPVAAAAFLDGIEDLVVAYGVGSMAEIAEGDAPHRPCGCIAQAWSVGEILRAWHAIQIAKSPQPTGALT
jgi:predicted glycogen debranching enzyme